MISGGLRAKLLVFAVFFVGIVAGALIDQVYETRWKADADSAPERRSRGEVDRMYDLLDLTVEQRQQWEAILAASKPDFDKLFEQNRKLLEPNQQRFFDLTEETRSKIRGILTESQRKKYNEYNERRRLRREAPRK